MTELVERLRELDAAATKGPWRHIAGVVYAPDCKLADLSIAHKDSEEHNANGELLVAMRNALPDLLAKIEHQAETIARLTAEVEAFEGAFRIQVWNACRASNMKQDAAILAVEKAIVKVRAALTDGRN